MDVQIKFICEESIAFNLSGKGYCVNSQYVQLQSQLKDITFYNSTFQTFPGKHKLAVHDHD